MKYTSNITYINWQLPDDVSMQLGLIRKLSGAKSREQSDSGNGRLYDSKLARFLSPDPVLQDPSNTQNYNRYSYCLNNPFAYIDPSGYVYQGYQQHQQYLENLWHNTNASLQNSWKDFYSTERKKIVDGEIRYGGSAGGYNNSTINSIDLDGENIYDFDKFDPNNSYDLQKFAKIGGRVVFVSYPIGVSNDVLLDDQGTPYPGTWISGSETGAKLVYIRFMQLDDDFGDGLRWNPIPNDISNVAGLGTTVYGGSASWACAELKAAGNMGRSVKYLKVGGNVAGGAALLASGYNLMTKYQNEADNTADWVDFGANGTFFTLGFFVATPVGVGLLVGAGIGYGIYRIAAGDKADKWINDKFGYR